MSARLGLCAALLAASLTVRASAQALPQCADLPNTLYLQIGDTQEPLIKSLGRALRDSTVNPITLVYITSGSCTNIEAIYQGVPITMNPKYVPSTAEDAAWTTAMPSPSCTIAAGGHAVDVANSALFVSACDPAQPPSGVSLFRGPVQAYGFVVPEASTQTAITAQEAYFVFGFGDQGKVTPWNDETFMFIRPVTKSTLLTLAAAIHVPGPKWRGMPLNASSDVLNALTASVEPEESIGILGVEIYDRNRPTLNMLAYQAYGQQHAYYPDSKASVVDKRNVRDGHYLPWSPTVWLTRVDAAGKPTNQAAEYLINLIIGAQATPMPDFEPLDLVIKVGLVPQCAMQVTRSREGGDLSLFTASEPCGCYYESKVATASAACKQCDTNHPCSQGSCRHGYCEAK